MDFELGYALMGLSPVSSMYVGENVKISNINFQTGQIQMTFTNLGTTMVSIKYMQVNSGAGWVQVWTASGTDGDIQASTQLTSAFMYPWSAGYAYEFRAVTAKGTTLSQTQVAS